MGRAAVNDSLKNVRSASYDLWVAGKEIAGFGIPQPIARVRVCPRCSPLTAPRGSVSRQRADRERKNRVCGDPQTRL